MTDRERLDMNQFVIGNLCIGVNGGIAEAAHLSIEEYLVCEHVFYVTMPSTRSYEERANYYLRYQHAVLCSHDLASAINILATLKVMYLNWIRQHRPHLYRDRVEYSRSIALGGGAPATVMALKRVGEWQHQETAEVTNAATLLCSINDTATTSSSNSGKKKARRRRKAIDS